MAYTPYQDLQNWSFWYRSVANKPSEEINPVLQSIAKLEVASKVATAGSCFAQNISKHLKSVGIEPFITEHAHPLIEYQSEELQYGLYTARYGNVYTSRQMLQLFDRAYGSLIPEDSVWSGPKGKFYDPFRPGLPGGFSSSEELLADREYHLACVRRMFEEFDTFVFTLGLTETWENIHDHVVFPSCPGAIAGVYDSQKYRFLNLKVVDVIDDLNSLIQKIRNINPNGNIILTVSPVALVATASNQHVLPATIYSKSVLRVAAQEMAEKYGFVDYFPSYEIITGPQSQGKYFAQDYREVTAIGVSRVMELFNKHYISSDSDISPASKIDGNDHSYSNAQMEIQNALNVICEELANDSHIHEATNSNA